MQNDRAQVIESKPKNPSDCLEQAKALLEQKDIQDVDSVKRVLVSLNILVIKQPEIDQLRQRLFSRLIGMLEDDVHPSVEKIREFIGSQFKSISNTEVISLINAEKLLEKCFALIENGLVEEITVYLQLLNLKQQETLHADLLVRQKLILKLKQANEYLQAYLDFINNDHQQAADRFQEIINQTENNNDRDLIKLRMLSHIQRIMIFDIAKQYSYNKLPSIDNDEEYNKARTAEYKQAKQLDKQLQLFDIFYNRLMNILCNVVYFQKSNITGNILPSSYVYRYAVKFSQILEKFELINEKKEITDGQLKECIKFCKTCIAIDKNEPAAYFAAAVVKLMLYRQLDTEQQKDISQDLENYEGLTKNEVGSHFVSLLAALEEKPKQDNHGPLIAKLTKFFIKQSEDENILQHVNCNFIRHLFFQKIFLLCKYVLPQNATEAFPMLTSVKDYNKLLMQFLKLGEASRQSHPTISVLLLSIVLWTERLGLIDERIAIQQQLSCHAFITSCFFEKTILFLEAGNIDEAEACLPLLLDKLFAHFYLFGKFCNARSNAKYTEFVSLISVATEKSVRHMISQMDGRKIYNADFNLHYVTVNTRVIQFFIRQFISACEKKYKNTPEKAVVHYKNLLPYCKEASSLKLQAEIQDKIKHLEQIKQAKSSSIGLEIHFNQISSNLDQKLLQDSESSYLQLIGAIKSVLVSKKDGVMNKISDVVDRATSFIEKNQMAAAEKELLEYFSHFDYSSFTQSGRDRLLNFVKFYFEKKLMAYAGKIRSAGASQQDVVSCYQKITLPELKSIATEKIAKLLAPPEIKAVPAQLMEIKTIASVEVKEIKKVKTKANKKNTPPRRRSSVVIAITVPEELEDKEEGGKAGLLPDNILMPSDAQEALLKLKNSALRGRAYAVGGWVGELINPVGKKTDIDFVFGAEPSTPEEQKDPKFILHLLQKTYLGAVVEQKDKRNFKVIFPSRNGKRPMTLDIWWSSPLSNPKLTNAEARKVDTYGGAWAAEQKQLIERLTKEDIEEAPGRDFTANAVYLRADGKPFDPTGRGYSDLIRKPSRLKCIIKIEKSFGIDAVRMLRALHFATKRNSAISEEMIAKIRALTLMRLREEKSFRVNIILKKLLTQGEAIKNFNLLRATGLLDKIYPDFANLLNENKHRLVAGFVYKALKTADDLYLESNEHQKTQPNQQALTWPSLSKICLTWIYAMEMMRKCKPSVHPEDYAKLQFDALIIEDAIRGNPFFNEQFMQLGGLVNMKLTDELSKIKEDKNEVSLRKLITEEQTEALQLEIQKMLRIANSKEGLIRFQNNSERITNRFAAEQKRIDSLEFAELIKVRNEQIVVIVQRFTSAIKRNIRSVHSDWERHFKQPINIQARHHNCTLVYRHRFFARKELKESCKKTTVSQNAVLVKSLR